MIKFIIDSNTNRILEFIPSFHDMKQVENLPEKPEEKIGKELVPYFNPDTTEIEWKYQDRPLSELEVIKEQLDKQNKKLEMTSQALQELSLGDMLGESEPLP